MLLLPGTKCYERFTDETIASVRQEIIDGISGVGLTPREKSRFQYIDTAFASAGGFASKIAADKSTGLERKKAEVAEYKAAQKEAEKAAAAKAKKNARKRGKSKAPKAESKKNPEDEVPDELKRDPAAIKASLSHMQDEEKSGGGGGRGGSGNESEAETPLGDGAAKALDVTEQEGAADIIYILGGDIPSPESVESLLKHDGLGGKSDTVESSLLHIVVELSSHRPVRAGLKSPSHDLKEAAKKNFQAWKNLPFLEVKVDTPTEKLRGTGQIAKDLLRVIGDTAVDRYMYDEWLKAATIITVPKTTAGINETAKLAKDHYDVMINRLREDCGGVSLAVHCMAEAVVRAQIGDVNEWGEFDDAVSAAKPSSTKKQGGGSSVLLVVEDGDKTLRDIASAPGKDILEGKIGSEMIVDIAQKLGSLLRVPGGLGRAGMPRRPTYSEERRGMDRTELLTFVSTSTGQLQRTQWMAMFENMLQEADPTNSKIWIDSGAFYKRTWRERILPNTISQIVGEATTQARRGDVLTFYDNATDKLLVAVHTPTADGRMREEHFDTGSSGCCSVPPGFARWCRSRNEQLSANITRAQQKYAALQDKLRMGEMTAKQVERAQSKIAAKSARTVALTAPVLYNMESALIQRVEDDLISLFPADGAIIRIRKFKQGKVGNCVWTTVEKDGACFGMRERLPREIAHNGAVIATKGSSRPSSKGSKKGGSRPGTQGSDKGGDLNDQEYSCLFVANFADGSRATVDQGPSFPKKPDGHGTIRAIVTGRDGLAVEVGTDGSISQRFVSKSTKRPAAAVGEICRSIIPGGKVIRYMESGNIQILFPSGQTSVFQASGPDAGSWIITTSAGYKLKRPPKGSIGKKGPEGVRGTELIQLKRCPVRVSTDPISLSKILQRKDGVSMITYIDGSVLTTHADGTTILKQEGSGGEEDAGFVTVTAPGFTRVELDIDVDENAFRHANGLRIALSKGGMQKRTGCVLSDGTVIEAMYNTKFTASVNGSLSVSKPDGTEIVASDDGSVEFRPGCLAPADGGASLEDRKIGPDGSKVLSEALSEPDTTTGAYFIDCYKGEMRTSDPENNIFTIQMDGKFELDLAGEDVAEIDTPAIVNKPIEPRLFVLEGNGYGYEFLRPSDVEEYFRKIQIDSTGTIRRLDPSQAIECAYSRTDKSKIPGGSRVHTYMYDVLVRNGKLSEPNCMDRPPAPDKPYLVLTAPEAEVRAREVIVVRNLEEMEALDLELKDKIFRAERECAEWRDAREATQDRFAVDDDRDKSAIDAEKAVAAAILGLRDVKKDEKGKERKPSRRRNKRGARSTSRKAQSAEDVASKKPPAPATVEGDGSSIILQGGIENSSSMLESGDLTDPNSLTDINSLMNSASVLEEKYEEKSAETGSKGRRRRPKASDPTRDVGGFWKSTEGVLATESIMSVRGGETIAEGSNVLEEEDLEAWQKQQSTMMGTSPEMLARAEKELASGAEIIPKAKQINGSQREYSEVANKVQLKPLTSEGSDRDAPVGSAVDAAKNKSSLSAAEEKMLQDDYERLQYQGEEMAREIAAERARSVGRGGQENRGSPEAVPGKKGRIKLNRYNAEDSKVRRKMNTSSTFLQSKVVRGVGSGGPTEYLPAEILQNAAAFEVTPEIINLGRLCAGCLYKTTAMVKNVGADTSRFRLTRRNQPLDGAGKYDGGRDSDIHKMRVLYRAGPLAAGMHAKLDVEFAASGVGEVADHFELVTEHQIIRVPIRAEIVQPLAHDPRHVPKEVTFLKKI